MGASSLTCLNPWQGLGALRMGLGGPKISKKMAQNASKWLKKQFCDESKQFQLPGKRVNLVWGHPA